MSNTRNVILITCLSLLVLVGSFVYIAFEQEESIEDTNKQENIAEEDIPVGEDLKEKELKEEGESKSDAYLPVKTFYAERDPFDHPKDIVKQMDWYNQKDERLPLILEEGKEQLKKLEQEIAEAERKEQERQAELEEQERQKELQQRQRDLTQLEVEQTTSPSSSSGEISIDSINELNERLFTEDMIDLIIEAVANEYEIPQTWIRAVIEKESNFNVMAYNTNTNGTADRGMMQINENTVRRLAKMIEVEYFENMEYIPALNIQMGGAYLSYLKDQNADMHYVFTSYNRGEGGARNVYENNGNYETDYSRDVISMINRLSN